MKRLIDIFFSTYGLINLLPILTSVAIIVRWDIPGPNLIQHRRVGKKENLSSSKIPIGVS
jgi:lipopolysaccharide/colanic/teichoic acid biosynthesis glycosyltransferase